MEKKWIVFQLLKVLEECHTKKIYHGDIKTENVLLTGWDWVLLSDFASFKPTTLPDVSFFVVKVVNPAATAPFHTIANDNWLPLFLMFVLKFANIRVHCVEICVHSCYF